MEDSTISKKDSTFSTKKSGKSESIINRNEPILSKTAQRFFSHIKNGITSTKSLMHIEKCKKSNAYKYLSELRSKGYIDRQNKIVEIREGTNPGEGGEGVREQRTTDRKTEQQHAGGGEPYHRAHSHQFWMQILYSDERYLPNIGKEYCDDGNRILLWENVIEIYAQKDRSWEAATVDEAVEKSLDYFQRVIARIQNQNKIILLKNRSQNIKIVKLHIGRVNDELAKDVIQSGDKFHVYAEDGKLRLLIDASHEFPELEGVHPKSAKPDMNTCEKHYKDWLEKDPPVLSEMWKVLAKTDEQLAKIAQHEENTSAGMEAIIKMQENRAKSTEKEQQEQEQRKHSKQTERDYMYG